MTKISIFKNVRDAESYTAGSTIFSQGEEGHQMFVIVEGQVDIVLDGEVVQSLEEGEFFGEMSMIDHSPRSASAVARTDCRLAVVDEKRFAFLIQQTPFFALQVMKGMADRLRSANAHAHR
jgi:CRP/FNR family cyclic AMP-dependent transcriptional regulator